MPTEGLCLIFKATLSLSQSISDRMGASSIAFSKIIAWCCAKLASRLAGRDRANICRYCRVIERIGDEEILYRRIPVSMGWYDSNGLSPESFDPAPPRDTKPGFLFPARSISPWKLQRKERAKTAIT